MPAKGNNTVAITTAILFALGNSLPDRLCRALGSNTTNIRASCRSDLHLPNGLTFIHETMRLWDVQGLQVAVVRRRPDSEEWDVDTRAFGVKGRNGEPMTTHTLFPIASNSKAFTAASVGLLVANESIPLSWSTKLHTFLPEFELQDKLASKNVNLVDALGHRSGMPRHDFVMPPVKDGSLKLIKYMRPSAEWREVWQYNNHMYNIAAALVERVSEVPFFEFAKKHLFEAIGFNDTTFYSQEVIDSGRVSEGFIKHGETVKNNGTLLSLWPWSKLDLRGPGAGCILMTAEDVVLWLQTLLSDGKSPKTGKQVVPSEVLAKMSSGISAVAPGASSPPELASRVYGMGFSSSSYQGHQLVEHGGALTGYHSQITRFSNDGLGIAVFVNEDSTYTFEAIRWRIAEELLGMPIRVDWNTRFGCTGRIPSPRFARPPTVPLSQLAAAYRNGAYGRFAFELKDGVLRTAGKEGELSVQLRLAHFDGDLFNLTASFLQTAIGEAELFGSEMSGLHAEFEVTDGIVQGFGIWGGMWGAGFGAPSLPIEGTAREKAEVWFEPEVWPWVDETDPQSVFQT
ncbi:beta-lactamase/transpeptidase-like protein [Auriculariales sp. MPI-PUGE-AT-0066]|nr:beta-lactamase/transpeptidase-like protein [Auriculariales sp. MPI-PUGE-AT-0066]